MRENIQEKNKKNIQRKIKEVVQAFYNKNWTLKDFLTEDDVRCRLFAELQSELRRYRKVSVHSEIRWYGNDGLLKYRSDIVIIDHDDLRVEESKYFKLPSKGYGFNNYFAIIEIKLRRSNNKDLDDKYNQIIQADIEKLKEIREKTVDCDMNSFKEYFVLAFDKRRRRKIFIGVLGEDEQNQLLNWDRW